MCHVYLLRTSVPTQYVLHVPAHLLVIVVELVVVRGYARKDTQGNTSLPGHGHGALAASPSAARSGPLRAAHRATVAAADYSPKNAFFFPGQGAQSVGMAKELCDECPAAKALFDQATEILGYDLLDVCVNGPAEKLNSTEVSQPAIYVSPSPLSRR